MWSFEPSDVDVFKLICLFEIFGLPDCSAELVLKYSQRLGGGGTRTEFLDLLASQQAGGGTTYAEVQRRFVADARRRFSPA
jgi:hypothetical protein